ncbi:erythrocyte membrane protein 1, EMP1, partial [Plasmodium reichenowi]
MLQNTQPNDVPQPDAPTELPMNTQPNTLYFDNPEEKPFIMSIHDRNLLSGEEYNYNINMSTNTNNDIPISSKNVLYSGIDLINDSLNSGNQPIDIYDELLKRKENELFGTNNVKQTNTHSVASPTNSDDPLLNQLELFHKWLDRHRDMCEKWDTNNKKEELLDKLKEEWENDNNSGNKTSGNTPPTSGNTPPTSDNTNSDIPSGKLSDIPSGKLSDIPSDKLSDIPSGKLSDIPSDNNIHSDIHPSDIPSDNNIHSDIQTSDIHSGKLSDTPSDNNIYSGNIHPSDIPSGKHVLNTDVSIQIDMNNPKTTNEFTYVDSNPNLTLPSNPNLVGNINPNLVDSINPNLVGNSTNPNLVGNNINPNLVGNQNPNITLPSNPNLVENNINPVDENPTNPNPNHVQIQMSVNNHKLVKEKYPIGDVWDI